MKSTIKDPAAALLQKLANALRCLHDTRRISDERAHDAGKQLKKARAALRLLRQ